MGRETDQYMNADEYVQELLINVRSLAGEYLNWKKQSVFAGEGSVPGRHSGAFTDPSKRKT